MQKPGPRLTVRGIRKEIDNLWKEIERDQDEAGTDGSAFTSVEAKVCRPASKIEGVRERSEGGTKADWKDAHL